MPDSSTASTVATPGSLTLVGHDPLFSRGMNAAIAIGGHYAYIGNRADGSEGHPHPGVLVVDIGDPSELQVVGEIGSPGEGNPGETSRELRVWPEQDLLMVLNFGCDSLAHDCISEFVTPTVRFYDIWGALAAGPKLVSTYRPSRLPHEFFLWQDPADHARALLFLSAPGPGDNLLVTDISQARRGRFREVASWRTSFPDRGPDDVLHSLSVSPDGRRAYLAHLTVGFFILDTSAVARGDRDARIRLVTTLDRRLRWPGPGPHRAVRVPGRNLVLTTDEVYGGAGDRFGCPWGWARLIDVANESEPRVVSEYRVHPFNDESYCSEVAPQRDQHSSFSTHNPTVTGHLAFVAWHSAGLQAFTTDDPRRPSQAAQFLPKALASVATEDPMLSSGPANDVMWSYPNIRDGLIYVVDVRNGLFVLRYEGPHDDEVTQVRFLEGNSNLGDAT
jgi:hypothetical protein